MIEQAGSKSHQIPEIIQGGIHQDDRGKLRFVNKLRFTDINRFYLTENNSINVVRAWQGHKIEEKFLYTVSGTFLVCIVKPDNWIEPGTDLPVAEFVLSEDHSNMLHIPRGYANGFKALEEKSILLVFSTLSLEDSKKDDYRFDKNLWYDWDRQRTKR